MMSYTEQIIFTTMIMLLIFTAIAYESLAIAGMAGFLMGVIFAGEFIKRRLKR
jgi:hypothetical protein